MEVYGRRRWNIIIRMTLFSIVICAIFWGTWQVIGGSVPATSHFRLINERVIELPFPVSRWWDVPILALLTFMATYVITSKTFWAHTRLRLGLIATVAVAILFSLAFKTAFGFIFGLVLGLAFGLAYAMTYGILFGIFAFGLFDGMAVGLFVGMVMGAISSFLYITRKYLAKSVAWRRTRGWLLAK